MENIKKSFLQISEVYYNEISFKRKGFKTDNGIDLDFSAEIGKKEGYTVTSLRVAGIKKDEYEFVVKITGVFTLETLDPSEEENFKKNSIAILISYVRGQVAMLTSQPGTDTINLPIINISKIQFK